MASYDPELSDTENLCNALHSIAYALRDLGFGGARECGPGAIEGHSMMMRDEVAPKVADAIREGLSEIAQAIAERE